MGVRWPDVSTIMALWKMVRHTVQRFDKGNKYHISCVLSGHILLKPLCIMAI